MFHSQDYLEICRQAERYQDYLDRLEEEEDWFLHDHLENMEEQEWRLALFAGIVPNAGDEWGGSISRQA